MSFISDAAARVWSEADASQAPRPRRALYRNMPKRTLDVLAVLVCLLPVATVILALAIFVARDGGRPFYRQARIGRNGQVYWMWKLRTMCHDAESALEAYLAANPEARIEWETTQKLREDPRITKVGRFLRKSSLDELPQLWNVLRGDMSLVGPRPMMVDQKDLYPGQDYYSLRPGLTGPWQVSSRNESSFADRARFDSDYAQRVSLATDVGLMMRTVVVVMRGTGY